MKKIISLLLSALMVFSVISIGPVAYAETPKEIEIIIQSRQYTGKKKYPIISVKQGGVFLKKNEDYTVRYPGDVSKVGIHKAIITIKETGEKYTEWFQVKPRPAKMKTPFYKWGNQTLRVSWKKLPKECSGARIWISTSRNFEFDRSDVYTKVYNVKKDQTSKIINMKNKSGRYWFYIETYKKVKNKKKKNKTTKVYGNMSTVAYVDI